MRTLEDGVRNSPNPSTATKGHLVIIAVVLTHHCHIVTSVHSRCGIRACTVTPSLLPWHRARQVSICLLLGNESKAVRPQLRQEGPLSPSSRRCSAPGPGGGVSPGRGVHCGASCRMFPKGGAAQLRSPLLLRTRGPFPASARCGLAVRFSSSLCLGSRPALKPAGPRGAGPRRARPRVAHLGVSPCFTASGSGLGGS